MAKPGRLLDLIDADQPQALDRLFEHLRIPSVSTDPTFAQDCQAAADRLVRNLASIVLDASRRDAPGHPMVVTKRGDGAWHFLFYGHYDVQPADPLELWWNPPFKPVLRETHRGKIISARGPDDDKGQQMTFLEAPRA